MTCGCVAFGLFKAVVELCEKQNDFIIEISVLACITQSMPGRRPANLSSSHIDWKANVSSFQSSRFIIFKLKISYLTYVKITIRSPFRIYIRSANNLPEYRTVSIFFLYCGILLVHFSNVCCFFFYALKYWFLADQVIVLLLQVLEQWWYHLWSSVAISQRKRNFASFS